MLCFICDKTGNVKRFTNDRLEKCNKMLAFRKKKLFKYQDIVLPRSLHLKGYHIICYNRFTVLKSKNRAEFESMSIAIPTTENVQAPNKRKKLSPKTEKNNALTDTETPPETPASTTGGRETHSAKKKEIKEEMDESHQVSESSILFNPKEEISEPSSTLLSLESFKMDTEPSFVTDISKAVILKSILTRKTPIKKDILGHTISFASGMNIWPGKMIFNLQTDMNPPVNTTEPRIVKTQVQSVEPKIVEPTLATCGLCNKQERRIGSQRTFPVKAKQMILEKVMSYARNSNERELLDKLSQKSFQYHALCLSEYRNKHERLSRKNCDEQDSLVFKTIHAEAFDAICAFIDDKIVDKQKIYYLSDLFDRYKALLLEIQDSHAPFDFESCSQQNLQEKIANHYYGILEVTASKTHKRKVVHKCNPKTNLDNAVIENADLKYDKLAFELRSAVKSMKSDNSTNDIPDQLYHFIGSLIQGSDVRQVGSENSVQIKSICESIVSQIHKN